MSFVRIASVFVCLCSFSSKIVCEYNSFSFGFMEQFSWIRWRSVCTIIFSGIKIPWKTVLIFLLFFNGSFENVIQSRFGFVKCPPFEEIQEVIKTFIDNSLINVILMPKVYLQIINKLQCGRKIFSQF